MAVAALQCQLYDCNGSGGAVMIGMQWQWWCCEEVAVARVIVIKKIKKLHGDRWFFCAFKLKTNTRLKLRRILN